MLHVPQRSISVTLWSLFSITSFHLWAWFLDVAITWSSPLLSDLKFVHIIISEIN